ncbi:MAG: C13 family peptidase [Arenimonas sp.]|uniref:C13 family peptidase n=1 Tax=Arenimonas sp. TaxID=1872635 RepID=UPI0025BADE7A|nr:C13 family peptidase [Arenimonas sp.]MBW8368019.1 C13 family peptidase [Arenimonas sp.]
MTRRSALLLSLCTVPLLASAIGFGVGYAASKLEGKAAAPPRQDDAALMVQLAGLAPQRPGHPDLFVLGFAGDGSEQVFENEVLFLRDLAGQRLDAAGRVITLSNHAATPPGQPWPEATRANLRKALAGLGERMDREQDVLLLYFTTHGTEDHQLLVRREGRQDRLLTPAMIRQALDESGIRHRVIAISACFAGGFIDALLDPDTLVLAAARPDRASFGCGNDSAATFFGRAWLAGGLNHTLDFSAAFDQARLAIATREKAETLRPSRPQLARGDRIEGTLAAWRTGVTPGPSLPYPYTDPEGLDAEAAGLTAPRPPAGTSR